MCSIEWNGALRNAEVRLDALKFNQRQELEALQLSTRQWRHSVDRYSNELALRLVKSAKLDLRHGPTFRLGNAADEQHEFKLSDEMPDNSDVDVNADDFVPAGFVDLESAQFHNKVKVLMSSANCTGLNRCFIETLTLERDDAYNGRIDFGKDFCAWIKALLELEADVHVQTLKLVACYDNESMDSVYKRLREVLRVQEYIMWKDNEADRCDELCVDLLKEANRVSIVGYCLSGDVDDDKIENYEHEGNVDLDVNSRMKGSTKNVLNFVFSAAGCEELFIAVECDGSGLINNLIRRFKRCRSTSQMVSTFTWQWGLGCTCALCERDGDWVIDDRPRPIAERHANPFKNVMHQRMGQLDPVQHTIVGQLGGDVYEFKNEHDGTYLTVIVAEEDEIVQFRVGRFEPADAAADHSPDKKRRLSENHEK